MIDTHHIHPDDLSLHAMRLLTPAEAAETQAHIQQCAECARAYQQAQDDLAIVALTVDLNAPQPQARQRFLDQVTSERRTVAPDDRVAPAPKTVAAMPSVATATSSVVAIDTPRPKRTGGTVLPWLGWAVAAGASFFAVSEYHQRTAMQSTIDAQTSQLRSETAQMAVLSAEAVKARQLTEALTGSSVMRVTLTTTPAAKPAPQARANYLAEKGSLIFIANNLQPVPLQKVYELWIIPTDGSAPVAVSTFTPDARGNASVILPDIPKGVEAKAFGVTLEAEGGSAKPTLPILLAGAPS